jgi:hypothetical protein
MLDADALLTTASRPVVLGLGGGGDVVGALATAEACRLYHGGRPIVGGTTWERQQIDPVPGPRRAEEIEGAEPIAPGILGAGPETRVRGSSTRFAESHMALFLGSRTLLVDPTPGPLAIADGLARALARLDADLLVLIDVGGDVLAHGDEAGLWSPLCDAVMLAAAGHLARGGIPVLAGVFAPGCDGELTPDEVVERFGEVAAAGGFAGVRGLTPPVAGLLRRAVEVVPTQASAQALRCFDGETGTTVIWGDRTVHLSPIGALALYFDVEAALSSASRLARAVESAGSLEEANSVLKARGIETELDRQRATAQRM